MGHPTLAHMDMRTLLETVLLEVRSLTNLMETAIAPTISQRERLNIMNVKAPNMVCPDCRKVGMAVRQRKDGPGDPFYGCTNYPVCRGLRDSDGKSRQDRAAERKAMAEQAREEGARERRKRGMVTLRHGVIPNAEQIAASASYRVITHGSSLKRLVRLGCLAAAKPITPIMPLPGLVFNDPQDARSFYVLREVDPNTHNGETWRLECHRCWREG